MKNFVKQFVMVFVPIIICLISSMQCQAELVITNTIAWCQSAPTFERQGTVPARVVISQPNPTYIWQEYQPVFVPDQTYYYSSYSQPFLGLSLSAGFHYGGGYYPPYWEYSNSWNERRNINETWRLYGFGRQSHSYNRSGGYYSPSAYQPVRFLPQIQPGRPFPAYNGYRPQYHGGNQGRHR